LAGGLTFKLEIDMDIMTDPHDKEVVRCETSGITLEKWNMSVEIGGTLMQINRFGAVGNDGYGDYDPSRDGYALYTYISSESVVGSASSSPDGLAWKKLFESGEYDFSACIFNLDPCKEKNIYIGTDNIGYGDDWPVYLYVWEGTTRPSPGRATYFYVWLMDYWNSGLYMMTGSYKYHDFPIWNGNQRCVDEYLHPVGYSPEEHGDFHILLLHEPKTDECYIR